LTSATSKRACDWVTGTPVARLDKLAFSNVVVGDCIRRSVAANVRFGPKTSRLHALRCENHGLPPAQPAHWRYASHALWLAHLALVVTLAPIPWPIPSPDQPMKKPTSKPVGLNESQRDVDQFIVLDLSEQVPAELASPEQDFAVEQALSQLLPPVVLQQSLPFSQALTSVVDAAASVRLELEQAPSASVQAQTKARAAKRVVFMFDP